MKTPTEIRNQFLKIDGSEKELNKALEGFLDDIMDSLQRDMHSCLIDHVTADGITQSLYDYFFKHYIR